MNINPKTFSKSLDYIYFNTVMLGFLLLIIILNISVLMPTH